MLERFSKTQLFHFEFQSLLMMHEKASEHNDAHLTDFLEGNYLDEQVNSYIHSCTIRTGIPEYSGI